MTSIRTLADLAAPFRVARKKAGLSQSELATSLGMSRATISAIESGRCEEIGFAKVAALLDRIGLEIAVAPRRGRPTIDELLVERRGS